MLIQRMASRDFVREYGVACQRLDPGQGDAKPPFGSMWSLLGPGEQTSGHNHHEGEVFVISRGSGRVTVDAEEETLLAGDAVYVPPYSRHTIHNPSASEDLLFLALYWEDFALVRRIESEASAGRSTTSRPLLVTITPPTPNGDLHLGHLSGPYLAADAFVRHQRMRGRPAALLTGADVHQSYVVRLAEKTKSTPDDVARRFSDRIRHSLDLAGVALDGYSQPRTDPDHAQKVQAFFSTLHDTGRLIQKQTDSLYCEGCERHLFEAYVTGRCPHCGDPSDGCACESCGRPNQCTDLADPICTGCGARPTVRSIRRIYFPLSDYAERLSSWLRRATIPAHLLALCETMLASGLPDIPISNPSNWGIPVPLDGYADQRLYVWFEMCPGYLAATAAANGSTADAWRESTTEIVQFFGFDNGYFHALLFPALLLAHGALRLPDAFVLNEFYRLEGKKFSTSRKHAIWAGEFLRQEPADFVRYYLAIDRPETRQTSFVTGQYRATTNDLLSGRLQTWVRAIGSAVDREFAGNAPPTGSYSSAHRRHLALIHRTLDDFAACMEPLTFSLTRAARLMAELVDESSSLEAAESWLAKVPARRDERRTAIALQLLSIRAYSMMAAAIMPGLSARLSGALGLVNHPPAWEPSPPFLGSDCRPLGLATFSARALDNGPP